MAWLIGLIMVLIKKKNLALVLSGGSVRGFGHIGVLQVLKQHNVPIDAIIGTSMGALIGGLYAAGTLDDFTNEILKLSKNKVAAFFIASKIKLGKSKTETIEWFLEDFTKGKKIENLSIAFTAVATDLKTGKEVFIEKGSLLKAIIASISIPGLFPPVEMKNKLLVDGGVIDPLPQKYGQTVAKKVISINAIPIKFKYKKEGDVFDIISESIGIITNELIRLKSQERKNTVFIQLRTGGIKPFDFSKVQKAINIGRRTTERNMKKIIKLVKS